MRARIPLALCVLLPALRAAGAPASEPPAQPVLRIEARMHTAPIWSIAADAANRYLVTGSYDKTARVWELATGRLLIVLRPPIGPGSEGRIDAVALSPHGDLVACSGWTGHEWDKSFCIYLFHRASGELHRRIPGLPNVVRHLAFSADGRFLAAALAGPNGIRVYTIPDCRLAKEDRDYRADSFGVAFGPSGRLATTCDDGSVRLYTAGFERIALSRAPVGKQPHGIAFSPDGARLAIGYDRPARVDVLSGRDLSPLFAPDTDRVGEGALCKVAWSGDGRVLYAAGTYAANGRLLIRRWEQQGRGPFEDIPAAANTITGLAALRAGVAFGAADPAFGVVNAAGSLPVYVGPPTADYRDANEHFLLSNDGAVVRFGFEAEGRARARFSIADHALTRPDTRPRGVVARPAVAAPADPIPLVPPRTIHPGLQISGWQHGDRPRLNSKPIPLEGDERSHCLAVVPGGESFLLGTSFFIRLFDRRGKEAWRLPAPGDVYAANVSGDGRTAVVAFADGTIHWYALAGHARERDLLTFFPHADRSRWIAWTASGFYLASLGGEELIGWHVNRGKDQAALFFPASHFRDTYCRPAVVEKVLQTLDEREAVRLADAGPRQPAASQPPARFRPVVRILSPDDGTEVGAARLTIRYTVTAPPDAPPTLVKVLVDGRPAQARDLQVAPEGDRPLEMDVDVPPRDCAISLLAANRFGPGEPETRHVCWRGAAPAAVARHRPKVRVLAVGISDYRHGDLKLQYADDDARAFVAAVRNQEGRLYGPVTAELLVDAEATRERIMAALIRLQENTGKDDLAMVFFSGHGHNDKLGYYYFLPADVDPERIPETGVVSTDILRWVERVAGTTVFFLDSCHAGNVMGRGDSTALLNALWQGGAVVYTASTGKEIALEDQAWGNGAFTKALVEGLGGKAGRPGRDEITVNMLDTYLLERVKELTGSRQTPAMGKPPTIPDFPIALAP